MFFDFSRWFFSVLRLWNYKVTYFCTYTLGWLLVSALFYYYCCCLIVKFLWFWLILMSIININIDNNVWQTMMGIMIRFIFVVSGYVFFFNLIKQIYVENFIKTTIINFVELFTMKLWRDTVIVSKMVFFLLLYFANWKKKKFKLLQSHERIHNLRVCNYAILVFPRDYCILWIYFKKLINIQLKFITTWKHCLCSKRNLIQSMFFSNDYDSFIWIS